MYPVMDYRFSERRRPPPAEPVEARANAMTLALHQQRVIDEKEALDKKHDALRSFLGLADFSSVVPDEKERERLYRQSWIMAEYSKVLGERIACFPSA